MNSERRTVSIRRPAFAPGASPYAQPLRRDKPAGRPSSLVSPSCFLDRRLASGVRCPSSPVRRLSSGFTLMELLVVISIIALLLGIIVPAYFSIREKAKYTKAKVTAKNLEIAFKAYLDHYRVWPGKLSDEGKAYEINDDICKLLRERVDDDNNKDGIAFYEFESTNNAAGALDPWSEPADPTTWKTYRVRVDRNYNDKIDDLDIRRSVIVWSVGTNRSDDINASPTKEGYIRSWD